MDRNALARATEATSAPTPGYLYADIAKNAATSPQTSVEICRYLTRRLATKSNPNVKHKCLRVIAKVAQSPVNRGMFQRAVVQDHEAVAAIKACLNFRGPPDAARGDQPYEQVRAAAKECLDAVYSDAPSSTAGAGGMMGGGGGSMQGIGGGGGIGIGGGGGKGKGGGSDQFGSGRGEDELGHFSVGAGGAGGAGGGGGGPDSSKLLRSAGQRVAVARVRKKAAAREQHHPQAQVMSIIAERAGEGRGSAGFEVRRQRHHGTVG